MVIIVRAGTPSRQRANSSDLCWTGGGVDSGGDPGAATLAVSGSEARVSASSFRKCRAMVSPRMLLTISAARRSRPRLRAGEFGYGGDGLVDLRFGVVVVRGEPDEWVDATIFGVERVVFGRG